MFETLDLTRMARAMAAHSGARLGVVARNIANADTPGFRAMDLPDFAETYRPSGALRTTRAGHLGDGPPAAGPEPRPSGTSGAAPNGNTVSLEAELQRTALIRRDHELALAVYRNTSDIIRASLGRGR